MPDEVETMAFTNEAPWHGLGVSFDKAVNVAQILKLAKIDWAVEKVAMTIARGKKVIEVPEHFALTRDDDTVLDVVGRDYVPVQNAEAFEFFCEYVEAGGATMETAGSLRGGRYVWGLANIKQEFTLGKRDRVKGYLLVACPHMQGRAFVCKLTSIRVVCMNTLRLALREGGDEFRMPHRFVFDASMREQAKRTIGLARERVDEFGEVATRLKKMKMRADDALGVFAASIGRRDVTEETERKPKPVEIMLECYERAPGAEPGNGWGVLNAVTYYVDHMASRTADKRLTNAWFAKGAVIKERALVELTR